MRDSSFFVGTILEGEVSIETKEEKKQKVQWDGYNTRFR